MPARPVLELEAARASGAKTYFTGKRCKHGHLAPRFTASSVCMECQKAASKVYDRRNYKRNQFRGREWYRKKVSTPEGREHQRLKSLRNWRRRLGLPEPTRPNLGACEICGKNGRMNLDHCHETGAFRGWLCNSCNRALGLLGDDAAGLEKALTYLRGAS